MCARFGNRIKELNFQLNFGVNIPPMNLKKPPRPHQIVLSYQQPTNKIEKKATCKYVLNIFICSGGIHCVTVPTEQQNREG